MRTHPLTPGDANDRVTAYVRAQIAASPYSTAATAERAQRGGMWLRHHLAGSNHWRVNDLVALADALEVPRITFMAGVARAAAAAPARPARREA